MEQLLAHLVGDFCLQSNWMANEKTKRSVAAAAHVATYMIPFLFITRSPAALAVIGGTHFVIDRYRLARYVCWAKNFLAPPWVPSGCREHPDGCDGLDGGCCCADKHLPGGKTRRRNVWSECRATGYPPDTPPWLAVWLMIWADQTMHLTINYLALKGLA